MNREGDKSAKKALRCQKQPKAQQQGAAQKKRRDPSSLPSKDAPGGASHSKDARPGQCDSGREVKTVGEGKRPVKVSPSATAECQRSPVAQRKLSDASNASEDLSKDSGCVSGKLSSSDSSSEISDCPSEGNKPESQSSDTEFSWIDGRVYVSPDGATGGQDDGKPGSRATQDTGAFHTDAGSNFPGSGGSLGVLNSSFLDLIMGETTEDLVREVEDLRSENEYLKDEVEELRCEMLEMRDMFQEEEVYQLQELRLQVEQANKTCRILQYRLRKAERRSIRVAQTGQVDGELVRTLEHDIKVAKSVSLRLHNELESVQKKNSQLEWDNEGLREKTQELEVTKQVLQAEMDKSSLRRKGVRSPPSKAERRLSQQIEDDSADLKCQLHFAKEELALMCKKLTKLVSESEGMREELAKYHSAYGDVDATQSPEGKGNSAHAREAEVKVHLKLVEEEATLLSRRIVELEVENRGLRAEMSDLREKVGGGGGGEEEDEETQEVVAESLSPSTQVRDREGREQSLKTGFTEYEQGEEEKAGKDKGVVEASLLRDNNQAQTEGMTAVCHITREGPVGGEWDPLDSHEKDADKKVDQGLHGMTEKDYETLLTLRDHSCIVSSAIQLLTAPPKNGHCASPSSAFVSQTEVDSKDKAQLLAQDPSQQGPLNEALELLQTMILAFIARDVDTHNVIESPSKQESVEDLRTIETRDKTLSLLHGLLQDLGAELQDGGPEFDHEAKAAQSRTTECVVSAIFDEERYSETDRAYNCKGKRLRPEFSPYGSNRKNWCYLSQEAAQLDQEDPVKTWDHLIMPLSFPDLDFEQMSMDRSHTAPEKTAFRIYYSPPSARRVQLAQLKQNPIADRDSITTVSPWCTPPTSFSPLCLGLSANLSDDMKEMTASWRQPVRSSSLERRGRLNGGWVDVACSGTQTHMKPQMVSVGLQTDGPQTVRNSPSRVLSSSLVSARTHHSSSSLERVAGRVERPKPTSTSPKLYRRHSASGSSSLPSSTSFSTSLSSSSSSAAASRERALWNLSHQSHTGMTWSRQTNGRAGGGQNHSSLGSEVSGRNAKPPSKPAGTNRYGLVTEFLRRVSGRAEKPVPAAGPKGKSGLKKLERVPTRPPAAPLHRNDSVTRIVNQRFMKQREEAGRVQREEKGSLNQAARAAISREHSLSATTAEEGNYDCSSSSTLTFCFARPSRSAQRQALSQSKLHRHRYPTPPVSGAGDSNCE
ncbi:uncharacterized protein [Centroberyx affinis]|uniref:uncharacterized protein n=1 Tax=Centroberyx affinis TaxID=166261 RepID=UPI003A5C5480